MSFIALALVKFVSVIAAMKAAPLDPKFVYLNASAPLLAVVRLAISRAFWTGRVVVAVAVARQLEAVVAAQI